MKKIFKNIPFAHPYLFILFNLLFLYYHNIDQSSFTAIVYPLVSTFIIVTIFIVLAKFFIKNSFKISIILTIIIFLFFSYGRTYDLILDQYIVGFEIGRHRYLLFLWALIFFTSTIIILRTKHNLLKTNQFLNIFATTLVLLSFFNIEIYKIQKLRASTDSNQLLSCLNLNEIELEKISLKRDIYYIVLDGYASSEVLKDVYNFDNNDFYKFLESREFTVVSNPYSNYPMTHLSLASSLNLEYINYFTDVLGLESSDSELPYNMIRNNRVFNFLKQNGYKIINFNSGWGPTDKNKFADLNIYKGRTVEFLMLLINTTMLRPLERPFSEDLRKSRMYTFQKLGTAFKIESPKFVMAHIMSPHPPYLFGENGEIIEGGELDLGGKAWQYKAKYVNQLIFTNSEIKKIIDNLINKSKIEPIIVLQSDHGPASTFGQDVFWHGAQDLEPDSIMLKERMGILNAFYLPDDGHKLPYATITPVNTFRLIFDYYFNTNCKLLEDKNYFSSYDRPYDFKDVSNILQNQK